VVPLEQADQGRDPEAVWPCSLSLEASDLGIRPGKWPQTVIVKGSGLDLPDLGFTFQEAEFDRDGDLHTVLYRSREGYRLTLWND
jgi:hypothetical protein